MAAESPAHARKRVRTRKPLKTRTLTQTTLPFPPILILQTGIDYL